MLVSVSSMYNGDKENSPNDASRHHKLREASARFAAAHDESQDRALESISINLSPPQRQYRANKFSARK